MNKVIESFLCFLGDTCVMLCVLFTYMGGVGYLDPPLPIILLSIIGLNIVIFHIFVFGFTYPLLRSFKYIYLRG